MIATVKILEAVFWFCMLGILYSYIIYPLSIMVFARLFKKPILKDDSYQPTVGVLVPAYNEEDVILKKIDNILAIDYPSDKLSIWIGSDCSSDSTERLVRDLNNPRVHLWVAQKRGGKTGIVNNLAPLIDAEIILMTDANTMHQPECINAMVRNFADERVGVVAGHIEHVTSHIKNEEELGGEGLYRVFESRQKILEGQLHSTISAFGGFYALRKKCFRPIPPNSYSNDDVLIPMNAIRQGYRVIYEPDAVSEEDFTGNVISEFSRRIRIGAGNYQAFFWLLDFLNPLRGWPAYCFFSHKVTRWFSPFFLIGIILSCAFLFYFDAHALYKAFFTVGAILVLASFFYKVIPISLTRHIFYFLAMNLALIRGFFRYVGGIKSAAWTRTERH
jgi:cellulose synthase/poly-beta-1,6-N-acetylglucosamine synthase-like glycosyltransferase